MSDKIHYCTFDFRKFVSVMRHVSGTHDYIKGVRVERAVKKGINLIATNGVTMAFNNDPEAEITEDFPDDLSVIPKAAWFNVKDTGKVVVCDDEISFEMDSKKVASVAASEHVVTDSGVDFPNYPSILDVDSGAYVEGLNTYVSPESLRCFMPNNAKPFAKGSWQMQMNPVLKFWTRRENGDDSTMFVTSSDPAFIGAIMPIDYDKAMPNLKMVSMMFGLNKVVREVKSDE